MVSVRISEAVGIRWGSQMMPNTVGDLGKVTSLFDQIKVSDGGSMEIGGVWAKDRTPLIVEITAQIVAFQVKNGRTPDGVIDPDGGTLREMNRLAVTVAPVPNMGVHARVMPVPSTYKTEFDEYSAYVAGPNSLDGFGQLFRASGSSYAFRRLVRVENCSINWYGIYIPESCSWTPGQTVPHIHFTPTPQQGGYQDTGYENFSGWMKLWDDYTSIPGSQIGLAGADQILVAAFYRNAQQRNLGDFLQTWQNAVSAAITAAIDDLDPTALRDNFTFERIVSSSFSNGWVAHQQFNGRAAGASDMTHVLFDLDGQAGGSTWSPEKGVIYLNRPCPYRTNPSGGRHYYVGGRWGQFASIYGGNFNTHACCRNHLLHHGVWQYCVP
jgi:hypothetical protein